MELQAQTELVVRPPKRPLRQTLRERIRQTYRYDTAFWRMSLAGPWGAGMFAFALAALGMPTGLGAAVDTLSFAAAGTAALFLTAHFAAFLLALTGLPVPRLFAGALLFDLTAIFLIFYQEEQAFAIPAVISVILTVAGALVGLLVGWFAAGRAPLRLKAAIAGLMALACLSAAVWPPDRGAVPAGMAEVQADSGTPPLTVADPSKPGVYSVDTFTYGSGRDIWQPEYGKDVGLISDSVDASAYLEKWLRLRTLYWGFDTGALPLNGRIWMPEGEGPFPLVLIVHGNHLMEDYSDDGYAYLGNLLASRGYVAVSVDENFLNYSVWSGIPENDMKARAWLLLKHLQQIGRFADRADTPLSGKLDFERIALIGHSRGGQAAAMAADDERWFSKDTTLVGMDRYHIRAVAAIAPTDKKVDDLYARLADVSYLTLQGARDGDVTDFDGERQYVRTSFPGSGNAFKASLYIADANHSQFNTGWGGRDVSYPKGILLSRRGMLTAEEQRTIAKVYISAFLESTLRENEDYLPLFIDYRTGLSWLPETSYFNRYEGGEMVTWARFDEDANRMTIPDGGTARGTNLLWKEEEAKNRGNSGKGTRGIVLERTAGAHPQAQVPAYSLNWEESAPSPENGPIEMLSFSLSNRSYELDMKEDRSPREELDIEVELESGNGETARVPLSAFMPLPRLPETSYTLHPWLDRHLSEGKYKDPIEAVFQTYRLPIAAFTAANAEFDPGSGIRRLTFRLTGGPGRVMLDDIGAY
ncbi:poly(ethylene terephthalate) hydrolase family protein [Paenibacillus sp. A14]|uniref:poly(ethylene terephthalate) hydrolase family protein n=1 Tax=Paenibacillus sp. A14 TaxID=3119820 RepID=UPI002FDF133D